MYSHVVHVTFGDTGTGSYGKTISKTTMALLSKVKDELFSQVKTIPFSESPFNIGDFGAADGATTMLFFQELITTLKQDLGPEVQFQVIYEDQPTNDFNSLFLRLNSFIPNPPSYVASLDNVFAMAVGTTFYQQCVPSESMHIIFSLTSAHWLSTTPVAYKNSIYRFPDCSEEEKELLRQQAAVDWERFLLLRGKELKRGGLLVVACPSEKEGAESNWSAQTNKSLLVLNYLWKGFRDEGIITDEELMNTNVDFCLRTENQLVEPFQSRTSPVSQAGLILVSKTTKVLDPAHLVKWQVKQQIDGKDERKQFADDLCAAHRCYSNSLFVDGLSEKRSAEEKTYIVDKLFELFKEEVIHKYSPDHFKNEYYFVYLFIKKKI